MPYYNDISSRHDWKQHYDQHALLRTASPALIESVKLWEDKELWTKPDHREAGYTVLYTTKKDLSDFWAFHDNRTAKTK